MLAVVGLGDGEGLFQPRRFYDSTATGVGGLCTFYSFHFYSIHPLLLFLNFPQINV